MYHENDAKILENTKNGETFQPILSAHLPTLLFSPAIVPAAKIGKLAAILR
jgi:hypothetical protein